LEKTRPSAENKLGGGIRYAVLLSTSEDSFSVVPISECRTTWQGGRRKTLLTEEKGTKGCLAVDERNFDCSRPVRENYFVLKDLRKTRACELWFLLEKRTGGKVGIS